MRQEYRSILNPSAKIWREVQDNKEGGVYITDQDYKNACLRAGQEILALSDPLPHLALEAFMEAGSRENVRRIIEEVLLPQERFYDASRAYAWLGDREKSIWAVHQDLGSHKPHFSYFHMLESHIPDKVHTQYYAQAHAFCAQFGYDPKQVSVPFFDEAPTWTAAEQLRDEYDVAVAVARGGLSSAFGFQLLGWEVVVADSHRQDSGATFAWLGTFNPDSLRGKRILILDKDAVSGRTLTRVIRELEKLGVARVGVFFNHDPGERIGTHLAVVLQAIRFEDVYYPEKFDYSNFDQTLANVEELLRKGSRDGS